MRVWLLCVGLCVCCASTVEEDLLEENSRLRRALEDVTAAAEAALSKPESVKSPPTAVCGCDGGGAPPSSLDVESVAGAFNGRLVLPNTSWAPVRYQVDTAAMGSDAPRRLYYYPSFLSREDCEYLIQAGMPKFEESAIMTDSHATRSTDEVRKSLTAYVDYRESPRMQHIVDRIHEAAGLPVSYGEDFQLTRYPPGGKYELHYDSSLSLGRVATFLLYLNDVEEGGETVFPFARTGTTQQFPFFRRNHDSKKPPISLFCDSEEVLKFKPVAGSALFWFNHHPDLTMDYNSLHGSCPISDRPGAGEKFIAQKWFRYYKGGEPNTLLDVMEECGLV